MEGNEPTAVISAFSSAVMLTSELRSESILLFVREKSNKKTPKESAIFCRRLQREADPSLSIFEMKIAMELLVPTNVSVHNQISSSRFKGVN